jgi:UDP-glucose 4-epimerase
VIVLLFNTVGPRQSGRYGMVIPNRPQRARRRASRDPRRRHADASFCHVIDTIRALVALMEATSIGGDLQRRRRRAGHDPQLADRVHAAAGSNRTASSSRTRRSTASDRGHAPPRAGDREDRRRDRLAADAHADQIIADVVEHARTTPAELQPLVD